MSSLISYRRTTNHKPWPAPMSCSKWLPCNAYNSWDAKSSSRYGLVVRFLGDSEVFGGRLWFPEAHQTLRKVFRSQKMLLIESSGQFGRISKEVSFRILETVFGEEFGKSNSPIMPSICLRPLSELVQSWRLQIRIHFLDAHIDGVELVPLQISSRLQQPAKVPNNGSRILRLHNKNQ